MVIDRLENIEKYTLLHPLFEQAIDFLKSHDLHSLDCLLYTSPSPRD